MFMTLHGMGAVQDHKYYADSGTSLSGFFLFLIYKTSPVKATIRIIGITKVALRISGPACVLARFS